MQPFSFQCHLCNAWLWQYCFPKTSASDTSDIHQPMTAPLPPQSREIKYLILIFEIFHPHSIMHLQYLSSSMFVIGILKPQTELLDICSYANELKRIYAIFILLLLLYICFITHFKLFQIGSSFNCIQWNFAGRKTNKPNLTLDICAAIII